MIQTRIKLGMYPGQDSSIVQWIFVEHQGKVIANLPLPKEWSKTQLAQWAHSQIDLYLKQQNGKHV